MIVRTTLIVIIITYMFTGNVFSGQPDDFSGASWKTMSQSQRILYVIGTLEGMKYGHWDVYYDLVEEAKAHPPIGVTSEMMEQWAIDFAAKNNLKKTGNNITAAQVTSGVTKMYADYRNQQIPIVSLVDVAIEGIKGVTKEEVENRLMRIRKEVTNGNEG